MPAGCIAGVHRTSVPWEQESQAACSLIAGLVDAQEVFIEQISHLVS